VDRLRLTFYCCSDRFASNYFRSILYIIFNNCVSVYTMTTMCTTTAVHSVLRLASWWKSPGCSCTCTAHHVLRVAQRKRKERKEQGQAKVEEKEVARPPLRPRDRQNAWATRRELKPSAVTTTIDVIASVTTSTMFLAKACQRSDFTIDVESSTRHRKQVRNVTIVDTVSVTIWLLPLPPRNRPRRTSAVLL